MPYAFICDAVRTPFGRYGGALAGVRADDLAAIPIRALMERNRGVDWSALDDVIYGCANQAGEDNRNVARMAALLAGLPDSVPGATVNRLCGSSLEALALAARAIQTEDASLVVAGGVESMSRAPFVMAKATSAFARDLALADSTLGWRFVNPRFEAEFGVDSMAETAENVALEFKVSRADQDRFAHQSQRRAAAAMESGRLAEELVPVSVAQKKTVAIIDRDEHPRPEVTLEELARLRPIVRDSGTITAGNASGINDGAGALLVASEGAVKRFRLVPRARVVATAVAGVPPRIMGMGPVPAIRKVLARAGLGLRQIDTLEVNEAFAAQTIAVLRELGIPEDAPFVNPHGGAIALGHPLGASGARLATTATYELQRTGRRYALCAMCIGVGQGIAMVLERVCERV
jgi:3-oxoadipyl-CoA thiolase